MTSVVVTQTTINASVLQESVSVSVTSSPINVTISPVDINSHSSVTIGTANGLSLSGQVLSLGLSSALATGALSSADWSTFNNKQNALGYTPVNIASADWIDLTDGGATSLHSHAGGGGTWGSITGTLSDQTDLQAALDAKQDDLTFPIASTLGGTGVNNAGTLTNASNTTITGGGTVALGGFTLTVPATGTAALLATANVFTTNQMIDLSSDVIGLRVQGAVGQTTFLQTWEDSSANKKSVINSAGELYMTDALGIAHARDTSLTPLISITKGEVAGAYSAALTALLDSAGSTSIGLYGLAFSGFMRPGSGNTNTETYPILASATVNGLGTTTRLYVYDARVSITSGAGTVANLRMFSADIYTMAGGTVTNLSGIYIPALGKTGGTLTNQYGIYLEDVNDADTLNYAIYTNAGIVRLGDQTFIDGSADSIQLRVQAHSTQTANLQTWENSSAGVMVNISGAGNMTITKDTPTFRLTNTGSGAGDFSFSIDSTTGQWQVIEITTGLAPFFIRKGNADGLLVLRSSKVGLNQTNPSALLHATQDTATTNAVLEVARIEARVSTASTGGANGFGTGLSWYAETATNSTFQLQGLISTSYIDATNASRKAKMSLSAYDTAARLGIEIEASGTAAKLGFYGVATVARATTGIAEAAFTENAGGTAVNVDSTFGGYTLQQIVQALQSIGVLT